ncbi:MAG: tRNA (N6-threonylcarbamoyladenosine(37)-N6)-methyltransferase TrmO [Pseudonocardia sp.]
MSQASADARFRPIGHVVSARREPAHTPIQSLRNPDEQAQVVVRPELAQGLDGLAEFDYAWLSTRLHEPSADEPELRVVPFMLRETGERVGVFATRYPQRPNPLGLSVVRVLGVEANVLHFAGVDLLDGTPVLDIKPWEQHLDVPPHPRGLAAIRGGWYQRAGVVGNDQLYPDPPATPQ